MTALTSEKIASICDHTFLRRVDAYRTAESPIIHREKAFFQFLEEVCQSAPQPYAVCVRAEDVPHAHQFLRDNAPKKMHIAATVGFPEGAWYKTNYKLFEAQFAMGEGADEIDMVLNYKALKAGDHGYVLAEIEAIKKIVDRFDGKLKLILETSELNSEQIIQSCRLAKHASVDFVKTSTGYSSRGAEAEKLKLMCQNFPGGIKISGGVTAENVRQLLSIVLESRELSPMSVRIGESKLLLSLLR